MIPRLIPLIFLLAAPLSGQQTIAIPVPDQTIQITTEPAQVDVTVGVQVDTDSLALTMAEAYERANASLLLQLAEQRTPQGPGAVERTVRNVIWVVLGIIAVKKLHEIATRPPNTTTINVTHEDGDIVVNVPPHEHRDKSKKSGRDDD